MSPERHPSHDLLSDHAAGALEPARDLIVSTHLASCPVCAAEVALMEAVGGALLAEVPPTPLRSDAKALMLGRIERPAPTPALAGVAFDDWIRVPPAVLDAARNRRRWVAPGVWVAPITGDRRGLRAYLLRIAPGMSVPKHTHRGSEMVCVLKGAFADGDDIHRAGDFAESPVELVHRPQATLESECVCLIAVEGALMPRDWVGRLFQPIVGI